MSSGNRGAPTLLFVPTPAERRRIEDLGGFEAGLAVEALCGFGPVVAAARAARLLEALRPARVLLVGIAGSYDIERLPIGSAHAFDAVAIDGIGAGEGESAVGPAALGFPQWPGAHDADGAAIVDRLELSRSFAAADAALGRAQRLVLLTTCSASDSLAHAAQRRRRVVDADAEDMEGFAIACACALAGVPLCIVRGISNRAGERDPTRWRIPAALTSARALAHEILREAHESTA